MISVRSEVYGGGITSLASLELFQTRYVVFASFFDTLLGRRSTVCSCNGGGAGQHVGCLPETLDFCAILISPNHNWLLRSIKQLIENLAIFAIIES